PRPLQVDPSTPRSCSPTLQSPPRAARGARAAPRVTARRFPQRHRTGQREKNKHYNTNNCCVHCILACLFCEFLTLCNIVLDCATCGSCAGDDSCFCCCCASEECGDCDLPCDMDCGIIDACCESADCLEICMECCSLCFSS
uniref:MyoD family inhibitor n=1 Tax=Mola mola TaxID=94237 RepID=A0A3Q3VWX0_MOLML